MERSEGLSEQFVAMSAQVLGQTREQVAANTEAWRNSLLRCIEGDRAGVLHLSIKRFDRAAVRDWRHLQAIKNEVAGPEREAVELFPAESRLVDGANEYHLWVAPEGGSYPVGYNVGNLGDAGQLAELNRRFGGKGRQRPWQAGLPTGRGRQSQQEGAK
jgi:hypothetical protein